MRIDSLDLGRPRWRSQAGRVETWYATFTDPRTGDGYWIHAETHAPDDGQAIAHGWFAVFPRDGQPAIERFGPDPVAGPPITHLWFDAAGCRVASDELTGRAGPFTWNLVYDCQAPPLLTFPAWAWEREVLPGAQVVPAPVAAFTGVVDIGDRTVQIEDAPGALAHIYGHGHAERWGWLHADLGRGDVIEVVTAVSRRRGLNRLAPMSFVQLRRDGRDWPGAQLAAAMGLRGVIDVPDWSVRGRVGRHRITVEVHLPPAECVALGYEDPDGATATCTNSERADADIVLERWSAGRWLTESAWTLRRSAHAEVGMRP